VGLSIFSDGIVFSFVISFTSPRQYKYIVALARTIISVQPATMHLYRSLASQYDLHRKIGAWFPVAFIVFGILFCEFLYHNYFNINGKVVFFALYILCATGLYVFGRYLIANLDAIPDEIDVFEAVHAVPSFMIRQLYVMESIVQSKAQSFQKVLQNGFVMLGLGNVLEHRLADMLGVDLVDKDDDKRHERLAGFYDDLGREMVMGNPE